MVESQIRTQSCTRALASQVNRTLAAGTPRSETVYRVAAMTAALFLLATVL